MGFLRMVTPPASPPAKRSRRQRRVRANGDGFPVFLPKEVKDIKDPFARALAQKIVRIPVPLQVSPSSLSILVPQFLDFQEIKIKMCLQMENFRGCVMSSCIKPTVQLPDKSPVVLLHCFDRFVCQQDKDNSMSSLTEFFFFLAQFVS